MGLPVWRAPSPVETKTAAKNDATAGSRSPIRRRRSPNEPLPRRSNAARYVFPVDTNSNGHDIETSREGRSSRRERVDHARRMISVRERILNDAAARGNSVPERQPSMHEDNMRPGLYRNIRLHSQSRDREGSSPRRNDQLPPYTTNFAPARYAPPRPLEPLVEWTPRPILSNQQTSASPRSFLTEGDNAASQLEIDETYADSETAAVAEFPPLRRMGHRTIVDGPLPSSSLRETWNANVDGLGDRDRSFSPDAEYNTWETMLTTIAPDTHLPSADSSFTSAAASASFSRSNSANSNRGSNQSRASITSNSAGSSRTHITVPSENAGDPACPWSPSSEGTSDTEAEDDTTPRIGFPASRHGTGSQRDRARDRARFAERLRLNRPESTPYQPRSNSEIAEQRRRIDARMQQTRQGQSDLTDDRSVQPTPRDTLSSGGFTYTDVARPRRASRELIWRGNDLTELPSPTTVNNNGDDDRNHVQPTRPAARANLPWMQNDTVAVPHPNHLHRSSNTESLHRGVPATSDAALGTDVRAFESGTTGEVDYERVGRLLRELSSRADIPADFWRTAGLTRMGG
ncbi:hypothetical protein M501DRAFT_990574 [Patellaria atrata CBS 101060]|uniref:Uncharacterized protein n=1 Tax=Patellaria atrata CBS 101060 TaxID=1346257 RepID=A0A9P4VUG6_9PEZI|nr:hypothetical protein M501DRAFT_990574 [Patellaria atrata CBS 101060]